jgi:hypothetical protein
MEREGGAFCRFIPKNRMAFLHTSLLNIYNNSKGVREDINLTY